MNRIKELLYTLWQAAFGGFLAGAIVTIADFIYILLASKIVWASDALWIMPFWGAVNGLVFSIPILLAILFVRSYKRIKYLDTILFSAVISILLYPIIKAVFFRQVLALDPDSLIGFIITSFCLALFFIIGIGLYILIKKLFGIFKIRWQAAALVAALIALIFVKTLGFVFPPSETSALRTYDSADAAKVADKPNILFVMVDALRHDSISPNGCDIDTPNMAKLADDGILYKNSFVNCSWTKPSVISMVTGLYPSQHNVKTFKNIINPEITTLVEAVQELGYYTIGFQNNPHLGVASNFHLGFNHFVSFHSSVDPRLPKFMLSISHKRFLKTIAGFMRSLDIPVSRKYKDARELTRIGIRAIEEYPDRKFFMYLHYMDPHKPYFKHPYTGEHNTPPPPTLGGELSQEVIDIYYNTYKGEIEYFDWELGKFIDYLKDAGKYDNTLIVLTSDHGDEFYEHGGWNHGHTLYNELIKSVLIFKFPFSDMAGTADSTFAQSIDIAPTIVSYVGGDCPENWQGIDLLSGERADWGYAISGIANVTGKAILNPVEKLYIKMDPDGTLREKLYFRLKQDPDENNNLAESSNYEMRASALYDTLLNREAQYAKSASEAMDTELDEQTLEQLKALGYLK
ncbi:MAG: sulfatase-like hydrolase/transferase [candidate division Zixibacteria bacterium]|nr:sulfatase-like hydrolase/transferase [candidate division Zixibacteria bacterium]